MTLFCDNVKQIHSRNISVLVIKKIFPLNCGLSRCWSGRSNICSAFQKSWALDWAYNVEEVDDVHTTTIKIFKYGEWRTVWPAQARLIEKGAFEFCLGPNTWIIQIVNSMLFCSF